MLVPIFAGMVLAASSPFNIGAPSFPWVVIEYGGAGVTHQVVFSRNVAVGATGMPVPQPSPAWFVRKTLGGAPSLDGAKNAGKVQWIDGRSCPQLTAVLSEVEHLPTFRPYPLSKIAKPFSDPPPTHSAGWTLSRWGSAAGAEVSMTLSDASGEVIGKWWIRADRTLKPCWRDTQPTYP
ncbi:hypothetical protein [Caulobacter sp.]|uniref:hypothetical protein n=1 Tax=Caulobacter sp. TaxID=78 RepID=UPI002B46CFC4|nr:hypothetical protein [Caulobacter sp.]HJV40134.1 hypothetical protein [Caulobacter sp.]